MVGMCCVEGLTASIASEVVVGPPREQAGSPGAPACSAAPPGRGQDHGNITFGPHYVSKHSDASLMTFCHQYVPEHSDVSSVTFCYYYVSEHPEVLLGRGDARSPGALASHPAASLEQRPRHPETCTPRGRQDTFCQQYVSAHSAGVMSIKHSVSSRCSRNSDREILHERSFPMM